MAHERNPTLGDFKKRNLEPNDVSSDVSRANLVSNPDLDATDYPATEYPKSQGKVGHAPVELAEKNRKIDLGSIYQGIFEKPATKKSQISYLHEDNAA